MITSTGPGLLSGLKWAQPAASEVSGEHGEQDTARLRPERSEVHLLVSDNSKALALLGWRPRVSLDEGLRRTIEFVRSNPALFRPATYAV